MVRKCFIVFALIALIALIPLVTKAASEGREDANPYVYVTAYELESGSLSPGDEAVLSLRLESPDSRAGVYNVMLSCYFPSGGLSLTEGEVSQRHAGDISPGENAYTSITVRVDEKCTESFAVIELKLNYSNEHGVEFCNSTIITPRLSKKSSLRIDSLDVAEQAEIGVQSSQYVGLSNTGDTYLHSIKMYMHGSSGWQSSMVLGSLEPGGREAKEFFLIFNEAGEQKLWAFFTYYDESGTEFTTETREYAVAVGENTGIASSVKQGKKISPLLYAGLLATILALLTLLIGIIKRKAGRTYAL